MEFLNEYRDKLYGGFLGKVIGVIHGANTEGWSYEKIKRTFGEITEYPFRFRNFCSDDDINGPIFYMRALKDFNEKTITTEQMAHTLLNYVAHGHGFFWWGGYGISTEHTAYENLLNGISPERSGSMKQNGKTMAEQIGGQIFSDCWGLLCPGDKERAADFAGKMSSITHDGDGISGGKFVAACVAAAFTSKNVEEILNAGLSVLSEDSDYAKMVCDVRNHCDLQNKTWEEAFYYVQETYGYQHYEGVCHIIPNAAVIVLSLLYGQGDYSKTINIANMCGWDTDCNVGNLGTILGVYNGAAKIEKKWVGQVNDFICASSVLGCLNIQTVSQAADVAAQITHKLYQREPDQIYQRIFTRKEGTYAHFIYPHSTHAFRCREERGTGMYLENTEEEAHFGNCSLKITVKNAENGDCFQVYQKTYYTPEDFDDSRYNPDFSPVVYPGDSIRAWIKLGTPRQSRILVVPYVKERIKGTIVELPTEDTFLLNGEWQEINFKIPPMENAIIEETGLLFLCQEAGQRETGYPIICYLDEWEIIQQPQYRMNFEALPVERWNAVHELPAHLTYLRGIVRIQDGRLRISGSGRPAESYTGSIEWRNYTLTCAITPEEGKSHSILFCVQGAMRSYAVSLEGENRLLLKKRFGEEQTLIEVPFHWNYFQEYEVKIEQDESCIKIFVDDIKMIDVCVLEKPLKNGCIGFGNRYGSVTSYRFYDLSIKGSDKLEKQ